VPWLPLGVAAAASTAIVASRLTTDEAFPMQAASILLAAALGYALDDAAAEVLGSSPTTLLRRRGQRLLLAMPVAVATWLVLLVAHAPVSADETLAFASMFSGLLGLALGIAGVAGRRSSAGTAGWVVAPALFALLIASTLFPPRWRPLPMGDIPGGWAAIDTRWLTAALVGAAAFLISSRDRASLRGRQPATRSPAT
jgi:hypothetical protein